MKRTDTSYDTVIIGGGLSGLSTAHFLKKRDPDHRLVVIEKADRFGGAVWTVNEDGVLAESGPHGFLDNCDETQSLLVDLRLDDERINAPLRTFVRYVYHQGRLKTIEQHPVKLLTAPLISPLQKIGVLRDLWKRPMPGEPSVAEWTTYHFGPALVPYLDAVYTGTYAGDIERLSIDAVMPGIRAAERTSGSVIRGLVSKRKAQKRDGTANRPSLPSMSSFPTGMQRLVDRLVNTRAPSELRSSCAATALAQHDGGWTVDTEDGPIQTSNVVLAMPINSTTVLLNSFLRDRPADSGTVPWNVEDPHNVVAGAQIGNVAVTLPDDVGIPPGFGFLIPEQEKKFILGALFSSNMFPGRAPEGQQLIEVLIGGRRHPERLTWDSEEVVELAVAELLDVLDLECEPVSAKMLPLNVGIPQLERRSPALLRWHNELVEDTEGLFLCGFGWNGIGVNDMIRTGHDVAERISVSANQMAEPSSDTTPPVKQVYF